MKQFFLLCLVALIATPLQSQDITVNDFATHVQCAGTIYDTGGQFGFYNTGEYGFTTVTPDAAGCVQLDFTFLQLGTGDALNIYDGTSIFAPLLMTLTNVDPMPMTPIAGANGSVTLEWTSDAVGIGGGFAIDISCGPCPTCTDGIQNGLEQGIDCGGPDCTACPCSDFDIMALPYVDVNTTLAAGNDYTFTDACNSFYMASEDLVYVYTSPIDQCLFVELSGFAPSAGGLFITDGCPDDASTSCIAAYEPLPGQTSYAEVLQAMAGETYYFTVSSSAFIAPTIDYTFTLSTNCPPIDDHDCLGAIPVCNSIINVAIANAGTGVIADGIDQYATCLSQVEWNSQWYTINVSQSGDLAFLITPDVNANYDWALYNTSVFGCENIGVLPNMLVSCNSYNDPFVNVETGMSNANGGIGNANGPGNGNGPAFNANLPVLAGESYALYISNVQQAADGFTLDFSESTAIVADVQAPSILNVAATCAGIFTVNFSEEVICTDVTAADFSFTGPGGPYAIATISNTCGFGEEMISTVEITLDTALPIDGGMFTFGYTGGASDLCGNVAVAENIPINIQSGVGYDVTVTPADCGVANGQIALTNVVGTAPIIYFVDGIITPGPTFTGLIDGEYLISVTDGDGCSKLDTVIVPINLQAFTAGQDTVVCSLDFTMEGSLPAGFTGQWTSSGAVTFTPDNTPNALLQSGAIGVYEIFWNIDNGGGCFRTDTVRITLTDPALAVDVTRESCPGDCDGTAEATFTGSFIGAPYTYDFSDGTAGVNPAEVGALCPGIYSVTVTDLDGCVVTEPFTILPPVLFELDSVTVTDERCLNSCDGFIEVFDVAGVNFSFDGGLTFTGSSKSDDLCTGTYVVIAVNAVGCTDTVTSMLSSPVPPIADFTIDPERNTIFTPFFTVDNNSFHNVENEWQIGEIEILEMSFEAEPTFLLDNGEPGTYLVQLIVIDSLGCTDTTSTTIQLVNEFNVFAPNAFTPDVDNVNDLWRPIVSDIDPEDYLLEIYDRYGNVVFETTDINRGWTGRDQRNGEFAVTDGVFIWKITGTLISTFDRKEAMGTVTILR